MDPSYKSKKGKYLCICNQQYKSMKSGRNYNVASMSQAELLARKAKEKKLQKEDFYKFQRIDEKKKSTDQCYAILIFQILLS